MGDVYETQPTSCTRNSVLILREDSCSVLLRWERRESISSMKMTAGWWHLATANRARTIFSPSPIWGRVIGRMENGRRKWEREEYRVCRRKGGKKGHLRNVQSVLTHLEVREEALILKNVALTWLAIHFPVGVQWDHHYSSLHNCHVRRLTNQCLACAWRSKQQNALGRPAQTSEDIAGWGRGRGWWWSVHCVHTDWAAVQTPWGVWLTVWAWATRQSLWWWPLQTPIQQCHPTALGPRGPWSP